jgi:NRPS condensation-like uncharacterized protein
MKKDKNLKWRKLDNTAKLFPVLANKNRTNVYRISVVLKENVDGEILKKAVEDILPWFDAFKVRLRKGFFWYYFEDNKRPVPVEEERTFPCRYINPQAGSRHLFRVTYYKKRINLEVFHAVTDGLGAMNFLKELTYCYLDLKHGRTWKQNGAGIPSTECLHELEDSYVKNYRELASKSYSTIRAFQVKGSLLPMDAMNVIHGYVDLSDFREVCREKDASPTQILAALLLYSIYQEYWLGSKKKRGKYKTIALNLPVNLRQFFGSETTMNFFAVTNIQFTPGGEEASYDEILASVKQQMKEKITRERMEEIISYNVGYEKKLVRYVPLFIKELGTKAIYKRSEKSYTMTFSNLGKVELLTEYQQEVESFHAIMGVGKTQTLKCTACSYGSDMVITFSSVFEETYLQRNFFRALRKMGVRVKISSNGGSNETV